MPAAKAIFFRMSGTWKALRIVASTWAILTRAHRPRAGPPEKFLVGRRLVEHDAAAAGRLDALAGACTEGVGVHGKRLAQLALGEHLDGDPLARSETLAAHRLERDLTAGVEAVVEIADVDRLRVGTEGLERHRLLHVRAAQLSHAHVDRHLPSLEAR